MATPLAVYNMLFNGTGIIYVCDTADNLNSAASGPVQPSGFDNTPANEARVRHAASLNSKLRGNRIVKIYLDPRPASLTPGPGDSSYVFLDIDPLKAVDITDMVLVKGLQEPRDTINLVVAANAVSFDRVTSETILYIDGGAAFPANVISTFTVNGQEEGDTVTIYGITGGNPVILDTAAFAYLERQVTLSSYADSVTLKLNPDGWVQTVPDKMDAAALRNLGVAVPAQSGVFTMTPAGGVAVIKPGQTGVSAFPGDVFEADILLGGGPVVLLASLEFRVDPTGCVNGQTGSVSGYGCVITLFGNDVSFTDTAGLTSAMLTDYIALQGMWTATWVVLDAALGKVSWSVVPVIGKLGPIFVSTGMVEPAAITDALIAPGIDGAKLSASSVPETALDVLTQAKLNSVSRFSVTTLNNVVAVNGGTYFMDATVGNLTATLPAIATNTFQILTFIKTDASINTITGSGDANVNGVANFALAAQYDAITIVGNGVEWFIESQMP